MQPVNRAVVFDIASLSQSRGVDNPDDAIAEFVRAFLHKLIGFMSVHTYFPGCLDEIERAISDLGLRGIGLGPNYQNFDPLGEQAFRVYQRTQALSLPILVHSGTSPMREAPLD